MKQLTFGEYIRELREKSNMPLRKLATELGIDQSTLGKIETNQRHATREMIPIIASFFNRDFKELLIKFLSEKIICQIRDEEYALDALKFAELSINYTRRKC